MSSLLNVLSLFNVKVVTGATQYLFALVDEENIGDCVSVDDENAVNDFVELLTETAELLLLILQTDASDVEIGSKVDAGTSFVELRDGKELEEED